MTDVAGLSRVWRLPVRQLLNKYYKSTLNFPVFTCTAKDDKRGTILILKFSLGDKLKREFCKFGVRIGRCKRFGSLRDLILKASFRLIKQIRFELCEFSRILIALNNQDRHVFNKILPLEQTGLFSFISIQKTLSLPEEAIRCFNGCRFQNY